MRRPFSRLLVLAAVLTAVGCEEESLTLLEGSASSLSVRVYVDSDGDGAFTSGADLPVASAALDLSGANGSFQVSADGSGLASFVGVPPGSYQLTLSGGGPTGSVLASATSPVVVAPFQGASLTEEFRFAFLAGSLAGRLFRDDDGNGTFDVATDLPAAGIPVSLFVGSSAQGTPQSSASTDAAGSFSFETLRPGTYTVSMSLLETMEVEGGSTRTITVDPDKSTAVDVVFTGTLLVDMLDARSAPDGQTVTVEGVVTWQAVFDTRNYFLQDGTAGVAVFDFDRPDLALGDQIRITGTKGSFRGETQISSVVSLLNLGNVGAPAPAAVTAAQINAGGFQGQLVTIDGVVQSVEVLSFENAEVTIRDAGGEDFSVFVDSRTGVLPGVWTVGGTFAVTGVLGTDDRNPFPHRVEVRGPDDILSGGSAIAIAEARGKSGEAVVVEGVVTWQAQWDSRVFFLQDATGGASVFDASRPALSIGDRIVMRATVGAFRGEIQLGSVESLRVLRNEAPPAPRGVTAAEINAGQFQGELVTVTGTVQGVNVLSFDNQDVTLRDAAGEDLSIYVDSRNGTASSAWTVGATVRVSGVLGTDDRNDLQHRIETRMPSDIVVGQAGVTSIAEARSMLGATLTVEGVVTWQAQFDSRVYFLQDETGGISTFHSGAPDLATGDRIRLTGDVGAFRGETQFSPTDASVVSSGNAVTAKTVTAQQINAGLFQGELVTVTGTVQTVEVLSFDNQTVTIRDGAGDDFEVYGDSRTGVASTAWTVGATVKVSGVLGTDNRNTRPHRIEVRSTDDVVGGLVSIAGARGLDGQTVTVEGVVTWQVQFDSRVYFFQDASGGISTFHSGAPELDEGDQIRVTGEVGAFRGESQLSPTDVTVVSTGNTVSPKTVTAAQINAGFFQGELVSVLGTVQAVEVLSFDNQNVTIRDAAGNDLSVYGDSRTGVASTAWTVGTTVRVSGVLGTDDRNALPHRIEVRRSDDVVPVN